MRDWVFFGVGLVIGVVVTLASEAIYLAHILGS